MLILEWGGEVSRTSIVAVVGRIMPPSQDAHMLRLGTCEYITLSSKGTLQVWLRLRPLRDEETILDYLDGPKSSQDLRPFPTGRKPESWLSEKDKVCWCSSAVNMEEGACKPRNGVLSREWKRQGSKFSPRAFRRNEVLPTLWFEPREVHFELLISRTIR